MKKILGVFLIMIFVISTGAPALAAEENQILQFNDEYKNELWGAEKIQAVPLWSVTKGDGAVVAVIDTGINYNHEDLEDNVWTNIDEIAGNGIDDDGNGYVDDARGWDFWNGDNDPLDDNGHGTSVAGVIAATGNNSKGIIGVAMNAKIMALKCMDANKNGDTAKASLAIKYAAENGADIINISWSAKIGFSEDLERAINYAIYHGATVVAASGNHYDDIKNYYPANNGQVITVGAIDKNNQRAKFSNWGNALDVVAPGVEIKSTNLNGYKEIDGTSMATGYVSGLAALLLHYAPSLNNQEVENILRTSANDLGSAGRDEQYGSGLVNGVAMLRYAATNYSNDLGSNFSGKISNLVFAESFGKISIAAAGADKNKSGNKKSKYLKLYEKYKKYKKYKDEYLYIKNLKAASPAAYAQAKNSETYKWAKKYQKYKFYKNKIK